MRVLKNRNGVVFDISDIHKADFIKKVQDFSTIEEIKVEVLENLPELKETFEGRSGYGDRGNDRGGNDRGGNDRGYQSSRNNHGNESRGGHHGRSGGYGNGGYGKSTGGFSKGGGYDKSDREDTFSNKHSKTVVAKRFFNSKSSKANTTWKTNVAGRARFRAADLAELQIPKGS